MISKFTQSSKHVWVRDFVSSTPTFNETRQSSVCISISQSEHVIGWRNLVACSYWIYENFLSAHVFISTARAQMHFFMYVCVMCALSNKNIKNFWYLLRESRQRVREAENSRTRHACWILLIVAKGLKGNNKLRENKVCSQIKLYSEIIIHAEKRQNRKGTTTWCCVQNNLRE